MKLFLLEQDKNHGYDTHDSCVVVAVDAKAAIQITPNHFGWGSKYYSSWCKSSEDVTCTYLGEASDDLEEGSIVCSSFNAG